MYYIHQRFRRAWTRVGAHPLQGKTLERMCFYLHVRSFCVQVGSSSSAIISSASGVPQESALGLILFTSYVSPIGRTIDRFEVVYNSCADDMQLYAALWSTPASNFDRLSTCAAAPQYWFLSNDLLLISDKSEAAFFRY